MEDVIDQLVVKESSILEFFKTYAVTQNLSELSRDTHREIRDISDANPYYLMKNEIFIKAGLTPYSSVVFHLSDTSLNSRKKLTNVYTYDITDYDSISRKLVLIDFKILVSE